MTTTGIIETDELISEARDQANREIGRLKAQNERLTAELKRALAKIDSLEPTEQEEGTDLLDEREENAGHGSAPFSQSF